MGPNQSPVLPFSAPSAVRYDGDLHLRGAAAEAYVMDTTYLDVQIEIDVKAGPPPAVLLGDMRITWPQAAASGAQTLLLRRRGSSVEVWRAGENGSASTLLGPKGRVRVGLSGPETGGECSVGRLELRREF
jgi:hypothetical protein